MGSLRQGDEQALEFLAGAFYAALAAGDTIALDTLLLPAATIAIGVAGEGYLLPGHLLFEAEAPRRGADAGRVARTDIRLDGHLAVIRVQVAARPAGAVSESEASDLLTGVRREGAWRVAHVVFGAWRGRPPS